MSSGPTPSAMGRVFAFALYVPVLLAVASLLPKCLFLLLKGHPIGLYGLAYGAALYIAGQRAVRLVKGEVASPWLDLVLALTADALLAVIFAPDLIR